MTRIDHVLKRPVVTEKSVAEKGKYTFVVHNKATKDEVKRAVKEFYGAEAISVNMINLPQKTKTVSRGQLAQKRKPFKKAIVKLKAGEELDFNAFK